MLGTATILWVISACLVFAAGLLAYVLFASSAYRIAGKAGVHRPWLSWVPILNAVNFFGTIEAADPDPKGEFHFKTWWSVEQRFACVVFTVFPILVWLGGIVSGVFGWALMVIYVVFAGFVYAAMYRAIRLPEDKQVKYAILTAILPPVGLYLTWRIYEKTPAGEGIWEGSEEEEDVPYPIEELPEDFFDDAEMYGEYEDTAETGFDDNWDYEDEILKRFGTGTEEAADDMGSTDTVDTDGKDGTPLSIAADMDDDLADAMDFAEEGAEEEDFFS